ncbi:MAG: DUF1501 domain-containing protein, partial [Bryobacteraceae bacterium]|nr:DUF1501 domain-containing protein [Bryobacteraceae bacterium]
MFTRRDLLKTLALAPPLAAADNKLLPAKADSIILLWMAGGMAQTETFDPKRKTPYEPGVASNKVLSTFDSIPTAVDNIRISEGLPEIAKIMDRGTLLRSHRVGDLGIVVIQVGLMREETMPIEL